MSVMEKKKDASNLIHIKTIKRNIKNIYVNRLNNFDEMGKFLGGGNKLIKEKNNLNNLGSLNEI